MTFTRRRTEDVGASVSPFPKDEPRLVVGLGHFLRLRVHLVDRSTQPTQNSFDVPTHICLPSLPPSPAPSRDLNSLMSSSTRHMTRLFDAAYFIIISVAAAGVLVFGSISANRPSLPLSWVS